MCGTEMPTWRSYHEGHKITRILDVQSPHRHRQLFLELSKHRHLGPPIVAVENLATWRLEKKKNDMCKRVRVCARPLRTAIKSPSSNYINGSGQMTHQH